MNSSEALKLFNLPLPELLRESGRFCDEKHPDRLRTYAIDRNINYTNICVSGCKFCAFYKKPGDQSGYVLPNEKIYEKIEEAVGLRATQILMQGGLHPDLKIEYFEALFTGIKERFDIQLHSLSAPEIVHIANISGLTVKDTLKRLIDAGLDSLPGGGAEILVDDVRGWVSPKKCTSDQWLHVMRTAAELDIRATATMVFGMGENLADRIFHLEKIRALQEETGVFTAFIPWPFQPGNSELSQPPSGGHDYLRTLAVSRLYLDNIDNIQASWVTQGREIAQMAMSSGANDIGSTMIEENVVAAAGVSHRMDESEIIELIHGAGYNAAQRTTLYEIVKTHPAK